MGGSHWENGLIWPGNLCPLSTMTMLVWCLCRPMSTHLHIWDYYSYMCVVIPQKMSSTSEQCIIEYWIINIFPKMHTLLVMLDQYPWVETFPQAPSSHIRVSQLWYSQWSKHNTTSNSVSWRNPPSAILRQRINTLRRSVCPRVSPIPHSLKKEGCKLFLANKLLHNRPPLFTSF